MFGALAFYLFATILIVSALLVITAKNPVVSVLFLILAFFNAAGLFVLLGAEFIAMILVIVYVGAVAVLFLFVVMMLDISFADLRKGAMQYIPLGLLIGAILLIELFVLYKSWVMPAQIFQNLDAPVTGADANNTEQLGQILYTDYVFPFQVSGLILLVAMVGAIVLTLRKRSGVLKQKVGDQVARTQDQSMEIKSVKTGSGVEI
jgi:NADH-quinone oxidoreductase subunit J